MGSRPDIDTYFMQIARVILSRSTCLHRQIGAVVVKGRQIVSTGYNGSPAGHPHCTTVGCAREDIPSGQRSELCRAAHAEQNAISFAARHGISIEGATLYATTYPCSWCAKSIVNSGITRVVYENDYPDPLAKDILSTITVSNGGRLMDERITKYVEAAENLGVQRELLRDVEAVCLRLEATVDRIREDLRQVIGQAVPVRAYPVGNKVVIVEWRGKALPEVTVLELERD